MRIIQVTHTFLPENIGGRETHVYKLSKALIKRGHDVEIVAGGSHDFISEEFKGIRVTKLPTFPLVLARHPTRLIYRIVPKLLSSIRMKDVDVVHAHDYAHFTTDTAALMCKLHHRPLVVTVHGFLPHTRLTELMLKLYDKSLGKYSMKIAEKIIAVSKFQAMQLLKRGVISKSESEKIITIPNGIDLEEYIREQGHLFRRLFQIDGSEKLILAVGRIIKRKGFSRLIEITPKLLEYDINLRIVIIGPDGGYQRELSKIVRSYGIEDKVILTGIVSNSLLKQAYRAADMVVFPSEYEGLPTALLEALAYGKPVLVTRVGGMGEVIENMVNGVVVEPDSHELFAGILNILRNQSLANMLGRNGKISVQSYDWKIIVEKIVSVYEEVLNGVCRSFEDSSHHPKI